VGVAILHKKPGNYDDLMSDFPQLKARLKDPVSKLRGAGPFDQKTQARVEGRILLIGDAAGYLDPITGEGIAISVRTAMSAIAAIRADEPRSYESSWRKVTRTYYVLTHLLLAAGRRPFLRRNLVQLTAAFPSVFGFVLGLLGGRGQPRIETKNEEPNEGITRFRLSEET